MARDGLWRDAWELMRGEGVGGNGNWTSKKKQATTKSIENVTKQLTVAKAVLTEKNNAIPTKKAIKCHKI